MNFAEGTRFTERKRVEQPSPFRHLLRPKSGGIAYVLDAMGDLLVDIVDVTIVYPGGRPSFVDLLVGRVREVRVHVQTRDVPRELLTGDYAGDANVRRAFQDWLNGIWAEKDQRIEHMLATDAAG
jgi:hypothetical protein